VTADRVSRMDRATAGNVGCVGAPAPALTFLAGTAILCAGVLFLDRSVRPCTGRIERVRDPRPYAELAALPAAPESGTDARAPTSETRRTLPGETVLRGTTWAGDLRIDHEHETDRGRPGRFQLDVSLPGSCDDDRIGFAYEGFSGSVPVSLRRDAEHGADVLLFGNALSPESAFMVLRRLPSDRWRSARRHTGSGALLVAAVGLALGARQRATALAASFGLALIAAVLLGLAGT
jgi:hypothetical protein